MLHFCLPPFPHLCCPEHLRRSLKRRVSFHFFVLYAIAGILPAPLFQSALDERSVFFQASSLSLRGAFDPQALQLPCRSSLSLELLFCYVACYETRVFNSLFFLLLRAVPRLRGALVVIFSVYV